LRRALLARALVIEPEVLLLDEPCSGLDRPSQAQLLAVLTTLMARGVSVVMTAHRASPLDRLFPRGAELRDGRLLLSS